MAGAALGHRTNGTAGAGTWDPLSHAQRVIAGGGKRVTLYVTQCTTWTYNLDVS